MGRRSKTRGRNAARSTTNTGGSAASSMRNEVAANDDVPSDPATPSSAGPSPLHFAAQPDLAGVRTQQSLIALDRRALDERASSSSSTAATATAIGAAIGASASSTASSTLGQTVGNGSVTSSTRRTSRVPSNHSRSASLGRAAAAAAASAGHPLVAPAVPTPHVGSLRADSPLGVASNGFRRSSSHLVGLAHTPSGASGSFARSVPFSALQHLDAAPVLSRSPSPRVAIRQQQQQQQPVELAGSVAASSVLNGEPIEVNRIVGEHLVHRASNASLADDRALQTGIVGSFSSRASGGKGVADTSVAAGSRSGADDSPESPTFGSVSHNLLGGEVTRDIYAWHERNEMEAAAARQRRRNSLPNIRSLPESSVENVMASDLREPGVFRRHYLANRRGVSATVVNNALTRNFIEFLAIYGFYGGDVVPDPGAYDNDDDYMSHLPSSRGTSGPLLSARVSVSELEPGLGADEQSQLLQAKQAQQQVAANIRGTSTKKAFFMVLKAFLGTGVLFLPKAFANGGIALSMIGILVIGFLTLHCMHMLIETSKHVPGSFGDIGEHYYGEVMKNVLVSSIAIAQAGFSCAYYIFVAQNLKDVTVLLSSCTITPEMVPDWIFIFVQFLIYVPLAWVRKIKYFSFTSLIADVFILLGLVYVLYYDILVMSAPNREPRVLKWVNMESFPLFIGTAMFAFEGICLILPIGQSMEHPEKFNNVLTVFTFFISAVFITIGLMGYLTFGEDVETVIFHNLNHKARVTQVIQLVYALAIMLSFPLTAYPCIRITEHSLFGSADGKTSQVVKWQKNFYRTFLIGSLAFIAYAGSRALDKFVSLVGCFACIPLSFIYPALFHTNITTSKWVKLKDYSIVVFGIAAMVYTTCITISQWYNETEQPTFDLCPKDGSALEPSFLSFIQYPFTQLTS